MVNGEWTRKENCRPQRRDNALVVGEATATGIRCVPGLQITHRPPDAFFFSSTRIGHNTMSERSRRNRQTRILDLKLTQEKPLEDAKEKEELSIIFVVLYLEAEKREADVNTRRLPGPKHKLRKSRPELNIFSKCSYMSFC